MKEKDYTAYLIKRSPSAAEILESSEFQALASFPRHLNMTNTRDHSIRVAVLMARLAERNGLDPASAIKTGLLHDMCYVNYYRKNDHKGLYCFYHPEEAADNAGLSFGLTEEEDRAIRAHMFPLAFHVPSGKLALTLTLSDKAVSVYEGLCGVKPLHRAMRSVAKKFLPELR